MSATLIQSITKPHKDVCTCFVLSHNSLYMLNACSTSFTCFLAPISLVIDYFILDSLLNVDFLSFSNWPILSNKALGVNLTTHKNKKSKAIFFIL